MKKFLALLLACSVVLSMGVTAMAENTTEIDFDTPVVPVEKLEIYDADDQLIAQVAEDDITELAVSEADKLSEEDKAAFLKAYAEASQKKDQLVQYCFWLDVPEEYKPENLGWIMMQFQCPGSGVKVYCNCKEVPVFYIGGMSYYAQLPEFGPVAINVTQSEGEGADFEKYTYQVPGDEVPSPSAPSGNTGGTVEEYFTTRVVSSKKELELCDANDNVLKLVPYEMTIEIQVTQGDRLPPNDEQIFMNAYERAKAIEDRIVKYFFWLDIPAVYIPENFGYGKFEFNCAGDNVECFVDGKPMEVVHVDKDDYFAKLTEFGPVMVVCD